MIKSLTRHGNSAALIIDKALLEILRIDMKTSLELVTDGENLIISPVRDPAKRDRLAKSLRKINLDYGKTLARLDD